MLRNWMGFTTLRYKRYLLTITGPYSQINTLNIHSQVAASAFLSLL